MPCRKRRIRRRCPTCKVVFGLSPALVRPRNWCSRECKNEWQRHNVNQKWLRAGQAAMRAKWRAMSPQERREKSNIVTLTAAAASPEGRRKLSETKLGDRNPMKRPEVAEKVSRTLIEKWSPILSDRMKERWRSGRMPMPWERPALEVFPNGAELELQRVLVACAPAFRYVGNGAFWIGPCESGARRNPDFVDSRRQLAILLHGEYWHTEESALQDVRDYESRRWKVLVVWSKELRAKERDRLIKRIGDFARVSSRSCSSAGRRSSTLPSVRGTATSRTA